MLTAKGRDWHKLFKKERVKRKELEDTHKKVLSDYVHLETEHKKTGGTVSGKPVIPEYIGFEEVDDMDGISVYRKDNFYVYRADPWTRGSWMIVSPEQHINAYIPDQFTLIKVLIAMGMDISIDDYIQGKLAPKGML